MTVSRRERIDVLRGHPRDGGFVDRQYLRHERREVVVRQTVERQLGRRRG